MKAFITGITGQDGSYLCELLLKKGYQVHGLVHKPDSLMHSHIGYLINNPDIHQKSLFLYPGTFEDVTYLRRIISKAQPTEFYHLAGQSSPRMSLELPETTMDSIGMGTLRILEIIRDLDNPPKFLYASSSEIFGSPMHSPQDELTPINPTTPYGAAKALAQQMTKIYRTAYQLPTCSAILYNHESPRRGYNFVSMKVAQAVAQIKLGLRKEVILGSLNGKRDWGWAPDYVEGMWRMLQQKTMDDFIFSSGKLHTVKELVIIAFKCLDLNWEDYVKFDHNLVTNVEPLAPLGNPTKAKNILAWENSLNLEQIMEAIILDQYQKLKNSL